MERIKRALEKARGDTRPREPDVAPEPARSEQTEIPREKLRVVPLDVASLEPHRIIAGDKQDTRTAAFDTLRLQVLREMREKDYRILAVTSPTSGCGKTTVAINLALSIAQQTEPAVLLGDFDLRQPNVCEYLGIDGDHDLSDFLEGRMSLEKALVDPGIPRLSLLPNTKAYARSAQTLGTSAVESLAQYLRSGPMPRIGILDLPSVLPADDMGLFLPQADCVLLVVAEGLTKKTELEETLRLLRGANLFGVVLNKSALGPRPNR